MNKLFTYTSLYCLSLLLASPHISFADDSNCQELKTKEFSIDLSAGQTKCVAFPKRINTVSCSVTKLNPPKTEVNKLSIEITQYYIGEMAGMSTYSQMIKKVGQKFEFAGSNSPDTMQVDFDFESQSASKIKLIGLSCKYTTFRF
ncbi:hypothetical protein L3V82_05320 [Thiotrichales bacterium 19S3-7]|nr:hypothetical protein [Thiotrichales bacterium 19S3-7]MCF6801513.1 hypothetical protein [Thiotrichales bacterium 19S3-11]